jgi:hypothetical protein
MESTTYMNGQPVTIIARENRNEVWVETTDGRVLRVFKSGLSGESAGHVATSSLKIDPRRSDGAR